MSLDFGARGIPHCCGHLRKNPSRDPVTKSELSINSMVEIKFHSNILEMRLVFSKAFGTRHYFFQ